MAESNVTDLQPQASETGKLINRRLGMRDTKRIAAMIKKSSNDERMMMISQENMIVGIAVFIDNAERDLYLWCADLLGLPSGFEFKAYREEADEEARAEAAADAEYQGIDAGRINWRQYRLSDEAIQERINDAILEKFDDEDADILFRVAGELMEREDFLDSINSATRSFEVGKKFWEKFQSQSKGKKPTASKTKKS